MLALNAISHFLVDWTCICALFCRGTAAAQLSVAVVLYNTLAFSTQCLIGFLLDLPALKRRLVGGLRASVRFCGFAEAFGMLLVAAGAVIPFGFILRVVIFALGNSLFHVAGGMVTLQESRGKAAPLGIFVAPGAFGVTLGTLWPQMYRKSAAVLAAAAVLCVIVYSRQGKSSFGESDSTGKDGADQPDIPVLPVVLLTAAVAVRAIGGSAASFSWKTGASAALILTLFVFLGKALGGFACDRLGAGNMSAVSISLAAVLTAFFASLMLPSLIGQMLLNLSMPVTLWLLYMLMPQDPGLAFGLAASALWPGTILGRMIQLSGTWRWVFILICFLFGLGAIIYSERYRRRS